MFKNYLKITFRNLLKHKVYSVINLLGLSIGLTCSMLILIFVQHEFSFDRFHKNADRIYRLGREISSAEGERREPSSSATTAELLLQEYPEVKNATRFQAMGQVTIKYEEKLFYEKRIYYVDPSVFDVFTFPMLIGDPKTALLKPYSVVITEEMAGKYFGQTNPIGKVLRFDNRDDFIVTGVIKNLPKTTHREINMLCSFETLRAQNHPGLIDWLNFKFSTYLLLQKDYDYHALEVKLPAFIKKHFGKDLKTAESTLSFYLMPLKKIYLYSHLDGNSPGLITRVSYFSILALFIVLIACINFMNLSTARSAIRAKEVGIRKVVGADKSRLVKQFLGETLIFSFLALFTAFLLTELTLPFFNNIIEEELNLSITKTPQIFLGFVGLAFLVGIISGSYPAFSISRFHPAQVLKGNPATSFKKSRFRSALVVLQFALSTLFICHTNFVRNQLHYMKNKDIGFNKKDVIILPIMDDKVRQSIRTLKKELKGNRDILNVAASSSLPGLGIPRNVKIPEGYSRTQVQLMDDINVDHDFIPLLGIEMAAGRNFSETFPTDEQQAIIINEMAARKYGWEAPLGKTIQYSVDEDKYTTGIIIGVVKNFHLSSMHRLIEPLFISNHPERLNHILIRIQTRQIPKTIDFIETRWSQIFPDHPFQYSFLEDKYDRYFRTIQKIIDILAAFSVLAIMLACMGIFALAAFIAEQRTREIGIRKVLGDTTLGIIIRLNKELLKFVLIATLFIIPYATLPIVDLGKFFPYLAETDFFLYFKSALLVFIVAFITISYQSIRAALTKPVENLRYE